MKNFSYHAETIMSQHCNLTELARRAGVSLTTASRALNNHPYVADEVRQKVFAAAAGMNYFPKSAARKKRLGIIISDLGRVKFNFYQSSMLFEIARQCSVRGIGIEMFSGGDLELVDENFLRAVIVFQESELLELQKIRNANFIGINTALPDSPGIFSDEVQGMEEVMSYLRRCGMRSVALLLPHRTAAGHIGMRAELFRQSAAGNGLAGTEDLILYMDEDIEKQLKDLVAEKKAEALFIAGEDMACEVNCLLYRLGVKIPDDLSVVSFESSGMSEFMTPPHTTVAQNFEKLVSAALDLAENIFEGKTDSRGFRKYIPFIFHERASVKTVLTANSNTKK